MNFMHEEAMERLRFSGQGSKLLLYKIGDYWKIPYYRDPTDIWIVKTVPKITQNMLNRRYEGFATFATEGELLGYCVLKSIEPTRRSSM